MADMREMVRVQCACGKRLLAPVSAAGRSSKCPKCGEMVTVPQAAEADFGEAPESVDFAMGKGITYCIVAGLIAAVVWAMVCSFAGGQLGLLICTIGAACGFGMMCGTKRRSGEVGVIAAGVSLGGVVVGKVLLAVLLASGSAGQETAEEQAEAKEHRDNFVSMMMTEEMEAKNSTASEEQVEAMVQAKMADMTDGQKQQYMDQKVSQMQARAKAAGAKTPGFSGMGAREAVGFLSLLLVFGMWDLIAIAGGAALAYAIATFNDMT